MVLDAHVLPLAVGHDVGLDVLVLSIPAQVAVKLPVFRRAGIAHLGRPHLLGRLMVSTKGRNPRFGVDGGVGPVAGPGASVEDAVAVGEEVA